MRMQGMRERSGCRIEQRKGTDNCDIFWQGGIDFADRRRLFSGATDGMMEAEGIRWSPAPADLFFIC